MKSFIIPAVAVFALATAVPASAADDNSHGRHDKTHQPQHTGPTMQQQNGPDAHHNTSKSGPVMHEDHPVVHHDMPKPGPVMHEDHQAPVTHHESTRHMPVVKHGNMQRYDWDKYQQRHTPPRMRHAPQLDFHAWHKNFEAPRHFHHEPYHRPNGWYYRHWVFGMVLPNFFWTRDYWITDYWNYDLPDPPYGYVWVREGDDALLVNVSSGYILQVVYDLFD